MRNNNAPRTELWDRTWMLKARSMLGLRQCDVAKACDISTCFYNEIEHGVKTPNVRIGLAICDALGVDVRNFMNERKIA